MMPFECVQNHVTVVIERVVFCEATYYKNGYGYGNCDQKLESYLSWALPFRIPSILVR